MSRRSAPACCGQEATSTPNSKASTAPNTRCSAIGDSLPFTSTDAETAASQIINACKYGDAELVISLPAQFAEKFHALFPGATADLFGFYNRFLPGPGGIGTSQVSGRDSQSMLAPSLLTALSDKAALDNNEQGER